MAPSPPTFVLGLVLLVGCSASWSEEQATLKPVTISSSYSPEASSMLELKEDRKKFKYVILAPPHVGTAWFHDMLQAQGDIGIYGDLFEGLPPNSTWAQMTALLDNFYSCGCPRVYEAKTRTCLPGDNFANCKWSTGFKWFSSAGLKDHAEEFKKYVKGHGVHVIMLTRENCVAKFVETMFQSQKRSSLPPIEDVLPADRVTVKASAVLYWCQKDAQINAVHQTIAAASPSHMAIKYEELANPLYTTQIMTALQQFMQCERLKNLVEQKSKVGLHAGSLRNYILNFDELDYALRGTEYAKYLNAEIW
jgi:hypothetical protein